MKIVCDSCGAKYSIADEKVAGKVFKIRCKKCSSVIVVKGDQEEGDESTRVFDYGAEAIWHVVIDGDQQGPFAPRQIADLLAEGKIDWEAYVWREGMDGWQPAKDVEVLVSAVMTEAEGGGAAPAAGKAAAASAYGTGQVFGGSSDMGADPFAAAADDGGLSGVMGKSAASAGGADLFARSDRSPFSGASDDDGMSRGQMNGHSKGGGARVTEDQSLTGQRNENSVLFSLSNLQALATGSGGAPASSRPKAGMAQGEGSGLIDIRALASATQAVGESRSHGAVKDSVEDLLSVGGGNAFSAASLAAPVAGEKPEGAGTNTKLLIALLAAVIALLGVGLAVVLMREPAAAPIVQAAVVAPTPAPAAMAPAPAPVEAPSAAAPGEGSPREDGDGEDKSDRGDSKGTRSKKPSSGGTDAPKAAEKPVAEEPEKPAKPSGDRSLDDLLDSALGGKPAKPVAAAKPTPAPTADLPAMPAREDVLGAMKGVTPRVQSCGNGQSGVAMAKITVTGATGRVTNVDVSGQFAGTPVASCVTKEVTKAKFPKFSQSTFSFSYPFKI